MDINKQIYYWTHMLDEAFGAQDFLYEDKEGKNINKAEKWIKKYYSDIIGSTFQNGTIITPRTLTQEIRNQMPNVRMADCKFLVGATRLYFENQENPEAQSVFNKINQILKIICTSHIDEYDNNLNNLNFDELNTKFSNEIEQTIHIDKNNVADLKLFKNSDYEIISIDSFQAAEQYRKYTTWCITSRQDMFDSYTNNGLGRLYFCLKHGFEKILAIKGEGYPMDEYGKSMIAISVNADGSLNTCTCRWNHDGGADDHIMDTKEISEFFGVNFYKVFVPYTSEDIYRKYKEFEIEQDELSHILNARKYKSRQNGMFYIQAQPGKTRKYISPGKNCIIDQNKIYHIQNNNLVCNSNWKCIGDFDCSYCNSIETFEGFPRVVSGNFNCSKCESLTSLKGAPMEVGGDFDCTGCESLDTLEGAPQIVGGDFKCINCWALLSLDGAPSKIGQSFICSDCSGLDTLEGAPMEVGGDFDCTGCESLDTLEGAPQIVGGDFICSGCSIESLEGSPLKVGGDFICSDCFALESLDGAPSKITGKFIYSDCDLLTNKQVNIYRKWLKTNPTIQYVSY